MPIYEYRAKIPSKGCSFCRNWFEYIQSTNEAPLVYCPKCGNEVKRMISLCHAVVTDLSPEHKRTEEKIAEYERNGLFSHAAELADKYSHETKDNLFKERALEDYKKAGYNIDKTFSDD